MANFDFLKKQAAKAANKVSQAAGAAAEKGSELAEIGKLKVRIAGQERKMEDLFYQIGKAVYESCSESGSYPGFVEEQCKSVTNCLKEIEELKGKIEWIKGGNVEENSEDFVVPEEEVVVTSMEPVEEDDAAEAEDSEEDDGFSGIEIPVEPAKPAAAEEEETEEQ